MTSEDVSLAVNGKRLVNWTSVTIRKSIEQFADEYDFGLSSERINAAGIAEPTGFSQEQVLDSKEALDEAEQDDKCEVRIGSELVMTGYVDNIDLSYDADNADLRIGGLSKTGDLVDSSAIYETGAWKDARLDQIVRDVCDPFGIEVLTIGDLGEAFKKFKVQQGEKCYELISRAISMRQFLAVSQPDGNMVLSQVRKAYAGALLELGGNVLSASIHRNRRDIHNRYIFKGQTHASDDWGGKTASQLEGVVEDPNVKRYRPLVILARKQRSKEDLGKRALWERNVRAGRGERYRYTVPGWLDNTGRLWETNTLVRCKDRIAKLDGEMLVATVEFSLAERLFTTVEVVPPSTFEPLDDNLRRRSRI
jgi:prophage tail gpP-like protein